MSDDAYQANLAKKMGCNILDFKKSVSSKHEKYDQIMATCDLLIKMLNTKYCIHSSYYEGRNNYQDLFNGINNIRLYYLQPFVNSDIKENDAPL